MKIKQFKNGNLNVELTTETNIDDILNSQLLKANGLTFHKYKEYLFLEDNYYGNVYKIIYLNDFGINVNLLDELLKKKKIKLITNNNEDIQAFKRKRMNGII